MSEEGIVSGSGEVATSTPNATPSAPATAISGPSAQSVATPQTPQGSATTTTSADDRSSWVPPHRIRETRENTIKQAQEYFGNQMNTMKAELENYKRQVQALVGVTPPANPEIQSVREQFSKLYPGLSKIEDKAEMIDKLIERAGDLEAQTGHYWQRYGQQTMDNVYQKVGNALGTSVSDAGKQYLHSSFIGWVQSSPALTERYANDPTIVDDFVNMITSNLIDPVRRSSTSTVVNRAQAQVPQDGPSGMVRAGAGPAKPANLDERGAMAWALFNQNKNK